jgi:hypothetical protein
MTYVRTMKFRVWTLVLMQRDFKQNLTAERMTYAIETQPWTLQIFSVVPKTSEKTEQNIQNLVNKKNIVDWF